ncbi:hypothetical protein MYU51_004927 [Penicillium brevicompactum]
MSSSRSNLHFLPGDPDKEEVEIESSGDISALQRYQWNLWCNTIGNRLDQRSRLLDLEAQLRENTQLEIALREKLQSLSQSTVQNQAESHESSKKTINMEHILGTHYAVRHAGVRTKDPRLLTEVLDTGTKVVGG